MRKVLPVDHPLYDSRDPDGYVRFKSAILFDSRKREQHEALKRMFFGYKDDAYGASRFSKQMMDLFNSAKDGTFIEKYLMNMDQYLSKKAIKKFFGKEYAKN